MLTGSAGRRRLFPDPRYGYRKIAELLRRAGWLVSDKRVERLWRREGLKVPACQPKRLASTMVVEIRR